MSKYKFLVDGELKEYEADSFELAHLEAITDYQASGKSPLNIEIKEVIE